MTKNIPLYIKVHEHLSNALREGVYMPGDQLPSEAELANELGVSMITIRRAMQELASEGWVIRQPGRGTFASKPTIIEQSFSVLTSFTSDMQQLGIAPTSTLLRQKVVTADESLAVQLGVEIGSDLFHLKRLRNGNGVPLLLESVYIPLTICPDLPNIDFSLNSLYETLTNYGVELSHSTQEFEPVVLSESEAKLLEVPALTPAFLRRSTSFHGETPVEWVEAVYRKDKFRFVVDTGKYSPKLLFV